MSEITLDISKAHWHSSNDRGNWHKFAPRKKAIRAAARDAAIKSGLWAPERVHVAAHIGYPRAGRADPSNASPVVKAMLDGLTDAGVWEDDDSKHVVAVEYRRGWPSGQPGVHTVRLVLTDDRGAS